MNHKIFDMHCHLQEPVFRKDLPDVIKRAEKEGIGGFVCNGSSPDDWENVKSQSGIFAEIVPFFGLHPWYLQKAEKGWKDKLINYLEKVPSGIGEVGVDKIKAKKESIPMEKQSHHFEIQIELAKNLKRPVIIHCVHAWQPLLEILKKFKPVEAGFMIHGFAGSAEIMNELKQMGGYFSFSGYLTKKRNKKMRKALSQCPIDRLLLETDSPYMVPPAEFGKYSRKIAGNFRNEPANLTCFLPEVCKLTGIKENDIRKILLENSERFLEPILDTGKST